MANLTTANTQVGTTRNTNLVLLISLVPDRATALSDGHQLTRNAVREQSILALVRLVENPLDSGAATLAQSQRVGDLHGSTTPGDTLLLTDSEKRSDGVDDQGEV